MHESEERKGKVSTFLTSRQTRERLESIPKTIRKAEEEELIFLPCQQLDNDEGKKQNLALQENRGFTFTI